MQSVEEFKLEFGKVYHNKILKLLFPFEEKRKTLLVWYILGNIVAALLAWLGILWIFGRVDILIPNVDQDTADYVSRLSLGTGFLVWAFFAHKAKNFENDIKKQVMPIFLKSLPGFKWQEQSVVYDGFIRRSGLIGTFNSRKDDDNFTGTYKDVSINICETELGEDRGCQGRSSYIVRFKGVLISLFSEKKYKGTILIKKRGVFCFKPENLQEVNLEDAEFEKEFNVYSNDQIEARYILTPSFIERFKNLKFAFNASKIESSINRSGIFLSLSINKDLFKIGKLHRTITDYGQFKLMIDEFASILELIDELKLNQNIGL